MNDSIISDISLPDSPFAEDTICITVMGFDFSNMAEYQVAPSALVLNIQESYAEQIGVPVSELLFFHNGRRMGSLGATMSEDQIEDGDFIKVKKKSDGNPNMKAETEKEEQTSKKCPTTEVGIRNTDIPNKRQKISDADNVIEAIDEENDEVFIFDEEDEEVFSCTKCYYSAKKISSVKKHMAWHGKIKEEIMTITVAGPNDESNKFRVKPSTQIEKVRQSVARSIGIDIPPNHIILFYDGERITERIIDPSSNTISHHKIQDGDVIEAFEMQSGC